MNTRPSASLAADGRDSPGEAPRSSGRCPARSASVRWAERPRRGVEQLGRRHPVTTAGLVRRSTGDQDPTVVEQRRRRVLAGRRHPTRRREPARRRIPQFRARQQPRRPLAGDRVPGPQRAERCPAHDQHPAVQETDGGMPGARREHRAGLRDVDRTGQRHRREPARSDAGWRDRDRLGAQHETPGHDGAGERGQGKQPEDDRNEPRAEPGAEPSAPRPDPIHRRPADDGGRVHIDRHPVGVATERLGEARLERGRVSHGRGPSEGGR